MWWLVSLGVAAPIDEAAARAAAERAAKAAAERIVRLDVAADRAQETGRVRLCVAPPPGASPSPPDGVQRGEALFAVTGVVRSVSAGAPPAGAFGWDCSEPATLLVIEDGAGEDWTLSWRVTDGAGQPVAVRPSIAPGAPVTLRVWTTTRRTDEPVPRGVLLEDAGGPLLVEGEALDGAVLPVVPRAGAPLGPPAERACGATVGLALEVEDHVIAPGEQARIGALWVRNVGSHRWTRQDCTCMNGGELSWIAWR